MPNANAPICLEILVEDGYWVAYANMAQFCILIRTLQIKRIVIYAINLPSLVDKYSVNKTKLRHIGTIMRIRTLFLNVKLSLWE